MNILIVKTSAIGDVTHTLPALHAIRKKYPDAHITWLIEEAASDLIIGHKALDRVLVSKRKRWLKDLKKGPRRGAALKEAYHFLKELRDTEYDLLIDFQSLLKSGILIALTRAKRKVGFDKGMEHAEHSHIFLNERIPPVNMDHHAVLRELMLLEAIGIERDDPITFDLPIADKDYAEIGSLLASHGMEEVRRLIAINPRATWETKQWGQEQFALLADKLVEEGNNVVFTGSTDDRDEVEKIISHMHNRCINLAGETSLKSLAALYKKAAVVISTDTGPMHIAAAVDTPVVALFGPTAPWRTGPFGERHKVLRAGLSCSPCFKRRCPESPAIECMKQLTVDMVLDTVRETINERTRQGLNSDRNE